MTSRPAVISRPILLNAAVAAIIVGIGGTGRLLNALNVLPEGLRLLSWSDVLFTYLRGLTGGRIPYWDTYFEYPPLLGYLSGLISLVSHSAIAYVGIWLVLQMLAAAAIAIVMSIDSPRGRVLRRWSLAPQLFTLGSLNVDLLPALTVVVAVALARRSRVVASVATLAVGAAVKIYPAFAIPAVLARYVARPRLVIAAGLAAAAIVVVAYLPSIAAPYSSLVSVSRYSAGLEANPDSIWRLVHQLVAIVAPAEAAGIIVLTTSVGLLATYVVVVLPFVKRTADPARSVGLAMIVTLLWSRLYSPQYSLWWLPFATLAPVARRTFLGLCAADLAVFGGVSGVTLIPWGPDDPLEVVAFILMIIGVVARHIALIVAATEIVRPPTSETSP